MKNHIPPRAGCHSLLPLFVWAEAQQRRVRVSLPVRWLRRRHPLSVERAHLVAELAGLGGER